MLKWCWAQMAKDVWDGEDLLSKILIPSDAKETSSAGAVLAWGHVKIFVGDDSPTSFSGHAGSTEAAWNARRSQPHHHWQSAGRLKAELRLSPVEICLAAENRSLQFLPPPTVHFMRSRWSFEFGFLEHTFRGPNTKGNLNNQHQWCHSSVHRLNKCSLKVNTEIHWWAKPASGPAFVRFAVWGGEERQQSDDCPNQYEITIVINATREKGCGQLLDIYSYQTFKRKISFKSQQQHFHFIQTVNQQNTKFTEANFSSKGILNRNWDDLDITDIIDPVTFSFLCFSH